MIKRGTVVVMDLVKGWGQARIKGERVVCDMNVGVSRGATGEGVRVWQKISENGDCEGKYAWSVNINNVLVTGSLIISFYNNYYIVFLTLSNRSTHIPSGPPNFLSHPQPDGVWVWQEVCGAESQRKVSSYLSGERSKTVLLELQLSTSRFLGSYIAYMLLSPPCYCVLVFVYPCYSVSKLWRYC